MRVRVALHSRGSALRCPQNFGRGLGAVTSSVARRGTSTSQVAAGLMDMARRVKTIQSQRAPAKEEQVEASRKSFFGRKSRAEGGQRKSRGEGLGEGESRGIFGRKSRVEGAGAKDEAGDGEKMRRRRSRAMAGRAEGELLRRWAGRGVGRPLGVEWWQCAAAPTLRPQNPLSRHPSCAGTVLLAQQATPQLRAGSVARVASALPRSRLGSTRWAGSSCG